MKSEIYYKDLYSLASEYKTLLSVTIELTTMCNWRCKHCYIPQYNKEGLSKERLFRLFKELREMGTFEVVFTGGEIFMRKDALEIIAEARKNFFDVKLFTNISLLNEDIICELSNLYISQVSGTLFSLNEDIHDSITRVNGSLKKTLGNLILLKKHNISVEIKHILSSENEDTIEEMEQYCKKNGFKYLVTTNIFSQTDGDNGPKKLRVGKCFLNKNITRIDKIRDFHCYSRDSDTYACNATRYSCTIESDGSFLACNNLNIKIDNILEKEIAEIWKKSEVLRYIQEKKFETLKNCPSCELQAFCNRCSGIALLEDGDIWGCTSMEREIATERMKNKNWYKKRRTIKSQC